MENLLSESLNLIDDIINDTQVKNLNFYQSVLKMMSSLYKDSSLGIFFCENSSLITKKAINNNSFIENYSPNVDLFFNFFNSKNKYQEIKTKKDNLLYSNTLFSKLAIKESVFGIIVLSSDKIMTPEIKTSFFALSQIISYKIKDYELNEVFKIQLKALQEAMTEKQEAYEIIKKQHKKLQELDKTKNLFLANISHELRTPLNAIIGFSQALDSKIFGDLNEKQAEYIKDIQISSLHLLGMINEILDISKLEAHAMKFSPIELNPSQTIQEVVNILEPLYENKNITVKFNPNFECKIKADYQKFQQILYNLLSNAIKFTKEKGEIEIIQSKKDKNYTLKIKDNGIGIDKKFHNKIFKKFVHINNVYSKNQNSTGLGLTITKELVKLHKGKISLESEVNKGTTFILEFKNIIL